MLIEQHRTAEQRENAMKRDSGYCLGRKPASSVSSLLHNVCTVLRVVLIFGLATKLYADQTAIATKRNHDFYISLTINAGTLVHEKDEYCASFRTTRGGEPTHVEDVFIEFAQQIGRLREKPNKLFLSLDKSGSYCGGVGLGKKYYQPAFYYVTVHYTDRSKKKRTCRFFLTVK